MDTCTDRSSSPASPPLSAPASDATIRALFESMHLEVTDLDARIAALRELEVAMKDGGDAFDREDYDLVSASLQELADERDQRHRDHEARLRLYEESIVALEQKLETRKRLLERVDSDNSALRSNSPLMHAFAHKQAELEQQLLATKQVLCSSQDGTR